MPLIQMKIMESSQYSSKVQNVKIAALEICKEREKVIYTADIESSINAICIGIVVYEYEAHHRHRQ